MLAGSILNATSSAPSTSLIFSWPLSLSRPVLETFRSSVTAPASSLPLICTEPSFTPVMMMVTVCGVPSTLCTVKVSFLVSPLPRYCTRLLSTL